MFTSGCLIFGPFRLIFPEGMSSFGAFAFTSRLFSKLGPFKLIFGDFISIVGAFIFVPGISPCKLYSGPFILGLFIFKSGLFNFTLAGIIPLITNSSFGPFISIFGVFGSIFGPLILVPWRMPDKLKLGPEILGPFILIFPDGMSNFGEFTFIPGMLPLKL